MANYINLRNDSRELLNIELVPKNQASTIRFKNNPPLNHQVDEQGVVRFALATDKIDRGAIANIAHDNDTNGLQVYGEDLQDFCISSVGSLNIPLKNLLQPMGPPPNGGGEVILA